MGTITGLTVRAGHVGGVTERDRINGALGFVLRFLIKEADRKSDRSDRSARRHIAAERRYERDSAVASRYDSAVAEALRLLGPVELSEALTTRYCSTNENIRGWLVERSDREVAGRLGPNGPSAA